MLKNQHVSPGSVGSLFSVFPSREDGAAGEVRGGTGSFSGTAASG